LFREKKKKRKKYNANATTIPARMSPLYIENHSLFYFFLLIYSNLNLYEFFGWLTIIKAGSIYNKNSFTHFPAPKMELRLVLKPTNLCYDKEKFLL